MLYTTLSSLKKRLGIATDNTDSDSELSLIIQRATLLIDSEIGQNLEKTFNLERVDGTGKNRIYTKYKPYSVSYVKSSRYDAEYNIDYIDGYVIYTLEAIPKGVKNISVGYEFGFDFVPSEVEEICLDLCSIIADTQGISGSNSEKLIDRNIKTQKLGELSITYFGSNELSTLSSFNSLNPAKNVNSVLAKYKSFSGLI